MRTWKGSLWRVQTGSRHDVAVQGETVIYMFPLNLLWGTSKPTDSDTHNGRRVTPDIAALRRPAQCRIGPVSCFMLSGSVWLRDLPQPAWLSCAPHEFRSLPKRRSVMALKSQFACWFLGTCLFHVHVPELSEVSKLAGSRVYRPTACRVAEIWWILMYAALVHPYKSQTGWWVGKHGPSNQVPLQI